MTKGRKLGAGIALLAMLASTAAQAAGELAAFPDITISPDT